MDEEDLAEAEESKKVVTKDAFSSLGSTQDEVSRRATVMDVFRPSGETMGLKLLRKMGWRDGQGVGPKVRRKARIDDGVDSGGERGGGGGGSDEYHLFAPENPPMISFTKKTDQKGLGYRGEAKLLEAPANNLGRGLGGTSDAEDDAILTRPKPKQKANMKRSGFGVGILNDNGSDDEDPYSMGPKISYNKTLGGDKKKVKRKNESKPPASNSNPLLRSKPVFISKRLGKDNSGFRRCHDGRLPLDGFVLSINASTLSREAKYPPPKIPESWTSSKTSSLAPPEDLSYQSTTDLAKASTLNPSSRASILGEAPLPGKSVFDFLRPGARDRIVNLTKNESLPAAGSESIPQANSDISTLIPTLDQQIASTALGRGISGFIPYADDPAKLSRYRAFLSYRANLTEAPPLPKDMRQDDWLKELHEFAHAATIFKPMTGVMASRFAPSSTAAAPSTNPTNSGADLLSKPTPKSGDPAEEAAKMNMFGPMTRSSTFFYPSRLLCKRFNVPGPTHVNPAKRSNDPQPPSAPPLGVQAQRQPAPPSSSSQQPDFGSRFQSSGFQTGTSKNLELVSAKDMEALRREIGIRDEGVGREEVKVVVDPERNEALERERPGEEVFRAIFGSDSESEEE